MRRVLLIIAVLLSMIFSAAGQNVTSAFKPLCPKMDTLIKERTGVWSDLRLKSVTQRGSSLEFRFTESLACLPWRPGDDKWLKDALKGMLPARYASCTIGQIWAGKQKISELMIEAPGNDGSAMRSPYPAQDRRTVGDRMVRRLDEDYYLKGLSGRHIALWQSHGRYYEAKKSRWQWQRAKDFTTVEDMYTQSYVLPYLIPMLENAGAYVMTPRERDTQKCEVICDNDPAFEGPREGLVRKAGTFSTHGMWKLAGSGFADIMREYSGNENPFKGGTSLMTKCDAKGKSTATWTATMPESGEYAVYISYSSVPGSSTAAHYSVEHRGGTTHFNVNQTIGGGTWIYLGTFEFEKDKAYCVRLDNSIPEGRAALEGSFVTADAVRFGGGMGKTACGEDPEVSGVPAYMEGALYNLYWSGADSTVTKAHETDYTNDYASRGPWVRWLSGGSRFNPNEEGLGIPIDLSLAFHTDAGLTPDDSIIGTLAIYTRLCENSDKFGDGSSRMASRELTDIVQTQVVEDIRRKIDTSWTRRQIWDRSYSESRTPGVPAMLLELLSHQNFADMKRGLDPSFRFTVARAVYKGMLKYLSRRYGCDYAVQPLPVNSLSAIIGPEGCTLSWKDTPDSLEPTAVANTYILYTRKDDGPFDSGRTLEDIRRDGDRLSISLNPEAGHMWSYRIVACNEGGRSFPSETASIGIAPKSKGNILIVNNFDRVSGPAWFDTPSHAGFLEKMDGGVPHIRDISYIGEQYEFRRELEWMDDDNPGFGASHSNMAGFMRAGNNFDFIKIHGAPMLKAGWSFSFASHKALEDNDLDLSNFQIMDLLCGKQLSTPSGPGHPDRFKVFPAALRKALSDYCHAGGNLIVSGANISTDIEDCIYPVAYDAADRKDARAFTIDILGWTHRSINASRSGRAVPMRRNPLGIKFCIEFQKEPSEEIYCVEMPDGLESASIYAKEFLRYDDTLVGAGICYEDKAWKAVSIGFPIETITNEETRNALILKLIEYLKP